MGVILAFLAALEGLLERLRLVLGRLEGILDRLGGILGRLGGVLGRLGGLYVCPGCATRVPRVCTGAGSQRLPLRILRNFPAIRRILRKETGLRILLRVWDSVPATALSS